VTLGAVIAGFSAPALIDTFGWRSIFIAGGIPRLVIAALLAVGVPGSLRLLVAQRPNDPRTP
jgi:AAHS family 4-hydroxybenzoate transporter-like MFS transporter